MKLLSRNIRLDTCSVPSDTSDDWLIFCRLTRNDVIGWFPSNVGLHRRANQCAPISNTMTFTGGSGTSVEVGRKHITSVGRHNNNSLRTTQHMFVLLIVEDMFDVLR